MTDDSGPRKVTAVLFDGFELMDVFGPLELFGILPNGFDVSIIGPSVGPVRSSQGSKVIADFAYQDAPRGGIVLLPGGIGTRHLATDHLFLEWIADWAPSAAFVTSVCTGSGVLAAAGLLDGYRATSNKRAFEWARSQGQNVEWVPKARWIEDRTRWTSFGVAAGMDMILALIGRLHGVSSALEVADTIEYEWHMDSFWDPFADKYRLVP